MSLVSTAVVALRESLEALLVIGILLGLVAKLGYRQARRPVILGGLLGLAVSIVAGLLLFKLARGLFEDNEPLFEGIASLVAVAVLTYMIVWMYRHTMSTMGTLHDKAKAALSSGKGGVLLGLAFVIVVREGIETVLFLATQVGQTTPLETLGGLLAGVAVSSLIAYLVFRGTLKLSIQKFFAVTGVLLVLFGGGIAMQAVHELSEPADEGGPGWFPESPRAWDWSATLPHQCPSEGNTTAACLTGSVLNAGFGYRSNPRWAELGVYVVYVGGLLAWYLRPVAQRPIKPAA